MARVAAVGSLGCEAYRRRLRRPAREDLSSEVVASATEPPPRLRPGSQDLSSGVDNLDNLSFQVRPRSRARFCFSVRVVSQGRPAAERKRKARARRQPASRRTWWFAGKCSLAARDRCTSTHHLEPVWSSKPPSREAARLRSSALSTRRARVARRDRGESPRRTLHQNYKLLRFFVLPGSKWFEKSVGGACEVWTPGSRVPRVAW